MGTNRFFLLIYTPQSSTLSDALRRSIEQMLTMFRFVWDWQQLCEKSKLHFCTRSIFEAKLCVTTSGAGKSFKVGSWHASCAKRRKKFLSCPPFLVLRVQIVVLVSAFVMGNTTRSVSCLLFYSGCLPCPAICKSWGGARSPCAMESAPPLTTIENNSVQ